MSTLLPFCNILALYHPMKTTTHLFDSWIDRPFGLWTILMFKIRSICYTWKDCIHWDPPAWLSVGANSGSHAPLFLFVDLKQCTGLKSHLFYHLHLHKKCLSSITLLHSLDDGFLSQRTRLRLETLIHCSCIFENFTIYNLSVPHKWGTPKLKKNYVRPIPGPTNGNQGAE